MVSELDLPGLSGPDLARRLRGPLLLGYSRHAASRTWFEHIFIKPALDRPRPVLWTPRVVVTVMQLEEGMFLSTCRAPEVRCVGRSVPQALRRMAKAIEWRLP